MLLAVLALAAASAVVASYTVKPSKARAFALYYGSVMLNDNTAPVSVDLATGKPTVKLINATALVNATTSADLMVVPLNDAVASAGSLLLNSASGEFNMIDSAGLVVKASNGGVSLPAFPGSRTSAVAAGDSAYLIQANAQATHVWLVNQTTVASAANANGPSTPRASAEVNASAADGPGAAVSANGQLWMLAHTPTGGLGLRQWKLPAGSDTGTQLASTDYGTVAGSTVAALATATGAGSTGGTDSGAAGGDTYVALATASELRVFAPASAGGGQRRIALNAAQMPSGIDQILPASNAQGRFSFLLHAATGWTLLSAPVTGNPTVQPVNGLTADATLVAPAQASGALYTMSTGTAQLWRITDSPATGATATASTVPQQASYPLVAGESADLSDTDVLARGTRVIFNSRVHLQALTVFADGSASPAVIDKRTAVNLNASGGIQALAAQHANPPANGTKDTRQQPADNAPAPQPAEPVNDKIDCQTVSQLPHAPVVQVLQRAARSVQLSWQYPRLSPQDCIPSTYTVDVTRLSAQGPKAPGRVTVQGQNTVNLGGLFPDTKYQLTVTAYINGNGTASAPVRVATSPQGPPAATNVKTTVNDTGTWTVTWNSCGGVNSQCVPTSNWQVIASFCDGRSLASPPANATLVGDPSAHTFSYRLAGGNALLGRALSFEVLGVGRTGLIGDVATDNACTMSWGHPIASQISLVTGISATTASFGNTATATATVKFSGDQNTASGGVGASYTFTLLNSDGTTAGTQGPGTATTARFTGIKPGLGYRASVTVTPPGHPQAAVTIGPVAVDTLSSQWPALAASASLDTGTSNRDGTLAVSFTGLSSATANGEKFSLSNAAGTDSALTCAAGLGARPKELTTTSFDPGEGTASFTVNRRNYYGTCTLSLWLTEAGNGPYVFGGTVSPKITATVSIPAPTLSTTAPPVFSAGWTSTGDVAVSCDNNCTVLSTALAGGWKLTLFNAADPSGANTSCGTASSGPSTVILADTGCVLGQGAGASWQVRIAYSYAGTAQNPVTVDVGKTAPSPVVAASDFTASWASATLDPDARITLSYRGPYPSGQLQIYHWAEAVKLSSTPANCTPQAGTGEWTGSDGSEQLTLSAGCLVGADSTLAVTVQITSTDNPNQPLVTVPVTGPVPTAPSVPTTPPQTPPATGGGNTGSTDTGSTSPGGGGSTSPGGGGSSSDTGGSSSPGGGDTGGDTDSGSPSPGDGGSSSDTGGSSSPGDTGGDTSGPEPSPSPSPSDTGADTGP